MNVDSAVTSVAMFFGSVISAVLFEKGVSIYQSRPFKWRFVLAIWLIVFAVGGFIAEFVRIIKFNL